MKKIVLLFLIIIFCLYGQVKEAAQIENLVQRQIESYLSQALPPFSYLITTSARVSLNRKQELADEVTDSFKEENNPIIPQPVESAPNAEPIATIQEPRVDYLPGLEPIGNDIKNLTKLDETIKKVEKPNSVTVLNPNMSVASTQEKTTTTKNYSYTEEVVVDELSVQIVLDENLDTELVATVKRIVNEKIAGSYGAKGSAIFSIAKVTKPNFRSEPEKEATKDLDYYLNKYAFLIYMFFAIFVFFIMLLIFFFFIWLFIRMLARRQQEELNQLVRNVTPKPLRPQRFPPFPPYPYGNGYYDPNLDPPFYNPQNQKYPQQELPPAQVIPEVKKKNPNLIIPIQKKDNKSLTSSNYQILRSKSIEKEEKFLEEFSKNPLVGRNYFLNLDTDKQEELIGAFPKHNTRKIFSRLNNTVDEYKNSKLNKIKDKIEKEKVRQSIFNKNIEALKQQSNLIEAQLKDVFGQISLLTSEELNVLFSSLDVEAVANSYQVIDADIIFKYLEKLPDKKKNEFLKAMKEEKPITEDEINKLKQIYRNRINSISRNIFIQKPNRDELQNKVFQTVKNKKEFLEKIKNTDPDFYQANLKYTIDFNDFINAQNTDQSAQFDRAVEDTDNDILTNALANIPTEIRDNVLVALPDDRREFINESIFPKIGQVDNIEEEKAQEQLLDNFRKNVFR